LTADAAAQRGALRELLGADALLTEAADCAPYLTDHRALYHGRALGVALPRNAAAVAHTLSWCNAHGVAVVPHGGNTSYCGGATPDESGRQLLLSLKRLNRIRSVDAANYSLVAEAGCPLIQVQAAADAAGRLFPLALGSQGSCQIGGNLSTNAGGLAVLRYGMMRDLVLGLEVALPDGRLLETLSTLRKDNTGYDVKALFLGAEGTLGVITAASLKLFPQVRGVATALAAVPDPQAAVALLGRLREASSDRVSSFELLPRAALELTVQHVPQVRDPFATAYPWYVLCELTSSRASDGLAELLTEALGAALAEQVVLDAALAASERERAAFWRLRESIPEAQRREGASLKHDISVPVAALPQFVARAAAWVESNVPAARIIAYGHVGDGNLHFNLSPRAPADGAALVAATAQVQRAIHDLVREFGGSFSAEHGIGRLKVAELERYADATELELMRAIKRAFDPNGIMNPGKVLRGP
jgi:FAD/FMN-containing dehydrogenase